MQEASTQTVVIKCSDCKKLKSENRQLHNKIIDQKKNIQDKEAKIRENGAVIQKQKGW